MEETGSHATTGAQFSPLRLLCAIAVVMVIAAGAYWYGKNSAQPAIPDEDRQRKMFGLDRPTVNKLEERFVDENGDLVADSPSDPSQWVDPDTLFFSYGTTQQAYHHEEHVWSDLLTHLANSTGKPVEFVIFSTPQEQIVALSEGRLHVTGMNPGNVPLAVNTCGYVPVCTVGKDSGGRTYTMQIIVPATSDIAKADDLRGRTLTFTDSSSNSGWKAPLVLLMRDFGLLPMRDYLTNSSYSHAASINGIAAAQYEAAAVASSEVFLAEQRGDVAADEIKLIYESPSFPYDCIGYAYNLKPELAEAIRSGLLSFDFRGTSVEEELGPLEVERFVDLSYKGDFALVREIDDAMGRQHTLEFDSFTVFPDR